MYMTLCNMSRKLNNTLYTGLHDNDPKDTADKPEQSDLGLHCLPFQGKSHCSNFRITTASFLDGQFFKIFEVHHEKTGFMLITMTQIDQSAQPCSLISVFIVHCLDNNTFTCYIQNFKTVASLCS